MNTFSSAYGLTVDADELLESVPVQREATQIALLAPGSVGGDSAFNSASGGTVNAVHVWGGTVSGDATWPNYNVPYIMDGSVTVEAGTALTLTAGTELRFNDDRILFVNGTLDAATALEEALR